MKNVVKVFKRKNSKTREGETSSSAGEDTQPSQVPHTLPRGPPSSYPTGFFQPPGPSNLRRITESEVQADWHWTFPIPEMTETQVPDSQAEHPQEDDNTPAPEPTQLPEEPQGHSQEVPAAPEYFEFWHPQSPFYIGDPGGFLNRRMIIYPEGDKGFCPSDDATAQLTIAMRSHWTEPWQTWGQVPMEVKKQMLADFEGKCIWHQGLDFKIRSIFPKKCAALYKGTYYNARHRGIKPGFLKADQWAELEEYWQTPEFQQKSEQGKTARASEKGGSLHTGGSISAATQKMRLEKKEKRTIPLLELHKLRHTKGGKKGEGVWVEPRAKEVWEKATKALEDWTATQASDVGSSTPAPLTFDKEKEIWEDAVGGVKKGSLYGCGSLYASDKHKASYLGSSATSPPHSSYDPEALARMEAVVAGLAKQNQETQDLIKQLLSQKQPAAETSRRHRSSKQHKSKQQSSKHQSGKRHSSKHRRSPSTASSATQSESGSASS